MYFLGCVSGFSVHLHQDIFRKQALGRQYVFGKMVIVVNSLTSSSPSWSLRLTPSCPVPVLLREWAGDSVMVIAKIGGTSLKGFLASKKDKKVSLLTLLIAVPVCDAWSHWSHLATSQRKQSVLPEPWNHLTLEPTHFGLLMMRGIIYSYCVKQDCLLVCFMPESILRGKGLLISFLEPFLEHVYVDLHLVVSSHTHLPGLR